MKILLLISYLVFVIPLIDLYESKPYSKDYWKSPPYPDETYFYSDYKLPANLITSKIHPPSPQNCPEVGKTLCKDVDHYPLEQILDIIKSTNSVNFNFTSIFSDESSNDQQPILKDPPVLKSNPKGLKKNDTRGSGKIKLNSNSNDRRSVGSSSLPKQILDAWQSVNDGLQQVNDNPSIGALTSTVNTSAWLGSSPLLSSTPTSSPAPLSLPLPSTSSSLTKVLTNTNANNANSTKVNRTRRKLDPPDDDLGEEICATKSMYITPRAALNDKSEWKYIVNLGDRDSRLKQIIKVEVCLQAGSSCSSSISLPFGYKTRCKQKYIKKKLLALDINGQTTSTDNFFVPSCCACQIYREINN
ncbi:uncharacterized protein LOC107367110 [Tetranychus urticae]|uniref:uncharacterized protein LOC107367110 n=1 Tax=Tetranychus urticae TaxID=32264 RepID=UPI00077BB13B|nr:uncharacterized protein LOC107367110 [Tetranychus urticae]